MALRQDVETDMANDDEQLVPSDPFYVVLHELAVRFELAPVIEDFFLRAGPLAGVLPRLLKADAHVYRVGRVPRHLLPIRQRLQARFGRLGHEYGQVIF